MVTSVALLDTGHLVPLPGLKKRTRKKRKKNKVTRKPPIYWPPFFSLLVTTCSTLAYDYSAGSSEKHEKPIKGMFPLIFQAGDKYKLSILMIGMITCCFDRANKHFPHSTFHFCISRVCLSFSLSVSLS